MKRLLLAMSTALLLASCATTSGLEAQTSVSDFDNSKRVSIAPHGVACEQYITCLNMGFTWSDKDISDAAVLVQITEPLAGDYHAISVVRFNIDGDIVALKPFATNTNDFRYDAVYKITDKLYRAPLTLLKRIEGSSNTKIQVIADGAIIEGDFKNQGDSTKGYHAMLRFLQQVDAAN